MVDHSSRQGLFAALDITVCSQERKQKNLNKNEVDLGLPVM